MLSTTLRKLIWLYAAQQRQGGGGTEATVTGPLPLTLANALSHAILSLTRYGLCAQDGTPTPDAPVDIVCNNGAIKVRRQSGMPLGYQMVEWLIPTGAIPVTGFKTKSTQEITTVFYRENSAACYLYSSDTSASGTTNTTAYLTSTGGNWRWNGKTLAPAITAGAKTSVQSANGLYFNGSKWGSYDGDEFVSTNDLSVSSSGNTGTRIYSMTIREGETVTLDLVPVQRLSDSAYGFYDKVSGNFYTNADATFTAGDPIADPVEIYTDGEDEVLRVSGINLLDPSTSNIIIGEQVNAQGQSATAANNWRTDYIPVVGGKTYIFYGRRKSDDVISAYCRMNFYKSDKTAITPRPSYTQDTPTVGTAPSNAAYVRLSCAPINSQSPVTRETFDEYNWMFAEASAEIPYQPYVQPQTASVPMLLSVGDVKDEAELISGNADRAIVAFRVSPDLNWALATGTGYKQFYTSDTQGQLAKSVSCMSNIAPYGCTASNRASYQHGCYTGSTGNLCFQMIGEAILSTVADWKAFLRDNGVYVVAVKATATTEQTTAQHLVTHQGANIVDSTANVGPVEAKVEYYAAS